MTLITTGKRRLPRQLKKCPLCNQLVRESKLQKHMDSSCSLRPNKPSVQKKTTTKMARRGRGSSGKKPHKAELSTEEMQRIFESKMASAGRPGSSRQH